MDAAFINPLPDLSASSEARHTRQPVRWVFAGLLLLASVMNYIDRQTLSVLAVTIQREFGLSNLQYGYLVQCFLVTYMVMYVVSGRLVDWLGAWRMQGIFLLAWSIANALTGCATGFMSLAFARAGLGAAEPGNYTASLRAAGDWFSARERSIAVGIYSMGGTLGAAIGVPLAASLALRFGWRSVFFVTGSLGVVIALAWILIYRDPPNRTSLPISIPWATVIRKPNIVVLLVTRMMTDSIWYFFLFWSVKFMQESYGLSLATVGTTLWVLYLSADVGSFLGGFFSGRLVSTHGTIGARLLVMLPVGACMLSLLVVPSVRSSAIVISLLSFLAFCHMVWMTNITTLTLDLFPREMVSTIQGMIGAASAAGGLLTAAIIGRTIQAHGYSSIFYFMAAMHPLAAIILIQRLLPIIRRQRLSIVQGLSQ